MSAMPTDDPRVRTLAEVEAEHVRLALEAFGWNYARTAKALGVDRRTVYRLAIRYGIERPSSALPTGA